MSSHKPKMLPKMPLKRIDELLAIYRDGLLTDVLPFWMRHAIDQEHGGFLTSLDRDGSVLDTDKSVWQQGRFAWMLGELFNNVEANDAWLEQAKSGCRFIEEHCIDSTDGRMWFQTTRDGRPIRKRRYSFSESFAAIAFGELAKATQDSRYADSATTAFHQFVSHNLDPQGVSPKFTNERPTKGLGFPMITIATAQELRESIGLPVADEWIDRSIDTIRQDFLKPETQCVMETVSPDGSPIDHFDGRTLNPGHAIEGAWFLMWEGKLRSDNSLIETGCQMLDWMWQRGWDAQHGGMLYFVDVDKKPVQEYWHDMKFWWPQNETIIATLLAYHLTGNEKYADWHTLAHDWAYTHFPDSQHGEWFGYLHKDGRLSVPLKGNIWKGPFHLPRMQLTCWRILEEMKRASEGRRNGGRSELG